MHRTPLAERLRPSNLDEVIGQAHLVGPDGIIRRIVAHQQPTSLIFWGPPGTGKTTLARIIAKETKAEYSELSAVTAQKKDVVTAIEHARQNWNLGLRTLLFVDEIHRFNKAQQDAFLPHVESGLISLVGATTENPSFEVIRPLLSRSRVLTLEPLSKDEVIQLLQWALAYLGKPADLVTPEALDYLAKLSGGDGRAALGRLELALDGNDLITPETIRRTSQAHLPGYDKQGDVHYDTISAFIKSLRGSDVTAALYYLSRMLAAGEDPKFIARRMIIFASEDVGLAGNGALALAVATFQAVERIGLPEARYNLYHCATALARATKSREVTDLMHAATDLAERFADAPIPLHLRNAPTDLMKEFGYGKGYQWQAGFKPDDGFLPEAVRRAQ